MKDKIINNNDTIKLNDLNYPQNITIFKNMKKKTKYNNNIIKDNLSDSLNYDNQIKKFKINLNNNSSFIYTPFKTKELPKRNKNINKKTKFLFPYYYYFLDVIFDNLINPRKFFCISKAYFTVYNFMCNIYDISTHLVFFRQLNLLNNIFIEKISEEKEKGIYDYKFNTININDNKVMETISKNLKSLKNNKSILYSNYFL